LFAKVTLRRCNSRKHLYFFSIPQNTQWHPDKNPDNPEATTNFQKISEAYATLSDDKKRRVYDQYGADAVNQMGEDGAHGPPFGGGGFHAGGGPGVHFRPGGGGGVHMSAQDAEAFFAQFFGHDDPFGGFGMGGPGMRTSFGGSGGPNIMFGGGGMPGSSVRGSMGGMPGGIFGSMGGMPMGGMPVGGMPGGRHPPRPKRYDAIPNGTPVSLKGLVSKAERNGDRGEIQDYDPSSGRYTVLVEDSDELLKVKPENLLQHVHVRIQNVESQPELNGLQGTILAWNDQKQRYNIYVMSRGKVVSFKPSNVILEDGTVGKIVNLSSKPELNGKFGTIKGWIRDSGRYDVQLSANQVIRIRVENIRV
jgi:hypothetical protein